MLQFHQKNSICFGGLKRPHQLFTHVGGDLGSELERFDFDQFQALSDVSQGERRLREDEKLFTGRVA